MNSPKKPLFKVVLKPNPAAKKVLFFVCSYKITWHVYALTIARLRRAGYEVVVYDLNDYILDNDSPKVLLRAVNEINIDINTRITAYKAIGIKIFDAYGNSLGSFIVYNYAIRYPLRKIVLNTGGYMSRIIFNTTDKRLSKTKKRYEVRGYDKSKLDTAWLSIDNPPLGRGIRAAETFLLISLKDKHIKNADSEELISNIAASGTQLIVNKNTHLRHSATVIKNAHSRLVRQFLLNED
jgi:pimeloyl-ACP methyl ester carboxylesterase